MSANTAKRSLSLAAAMLAATLVSSPASADLRNLVQNHLQAQLQQRVLSPAPGVVTGVPTIQRPQGFASSASFQTCFTPGNDCTGLIVQTIREARSQVLVMAYEFTSDPIEQALLDAKRRHIDVRVVLDKSQTKPDRRSARLFTQAGIPVVIDAQPAIAHNKVMILDGVSVITGSFNFTLSAQTRNAENVLIVRNAPELARSYIGNWDARARASVPFGG